MLAVHETNEMQFNIVLPENAETFKRQAFELYEQLAVEWEKVPFAWFRFFIDGEENEDFYELLLKHFHEKLMTLGEYPVNIEYWLEADYLEANKFLHDQYDYFESLFIDDVTSLWRQHYLVFGADNSFEFENVPLQEVW